MGRAYGSFLCSKIFKSQRIISVCIPLSHVLAREFEPPTEDPTPTNEKRTYIDDLDKGYKKRVSEVVSEAKNVNKLSYLFRSTM